MTRAREPPTGPVVDCMERDCKCEKKRIQLSLTTSLPFRTHSPWLVIMVRLTLVIRAFGAVVQVG